MEPVQLRPATADDIPLLGTIEQAADRLFIQVGHPEFSGTISDDEAAIAVA